MPSLLLPFRITQQPQQAVPVDGSNPLAANLVSLVLPVAYPGLDLVASKIMTAVNAPGIAAGRGGMGLVFNGTSNYTYRSAPELGNGGKYTLVAVVQSNGNGTDARMLSLGASTGVAPIVAIGAGASNAQKVRMYSRNDSATSPTDVDSNGTPFDGKLHTIVMTYDLSGSTGRLALFIDGVLDTVVTGSNSVSNTSVNQFAIGCLLRNAAASYWKGSVFLAGAFNRALSDNDARSLSANAWQLLKPAARRLLVSTSASTETLLTPASASFILTGQAPTLEQTANQDVNPAAALLALSGNAPTLEQTVNQFIVPAAGEIAFVGYAPTVTQSSTIDIAPAAALLDLHGLAPTLEQTQTIDLMPAAGVLALDGLAPTVSQQLMPADPRYARPVADLAAGGWAAFDGGSLAAAIDEASPDDSTYIATSSASACEIKLSPVTDPGTSSGQVVRYRVGSSSQSGLTVRLKQGSTLIAEWTHAMLPVSLTTFERTLTAGQCDSITNYSDLRFEFEAF